MLPSTFMLFILGPKTNVLEQAYNYLVSLLPWLDCILFIDFKKIHNGAGKVYGIHHISLDIDSEMQGGFPCYGPYWQIDSP